MPVSLPSAAAHTPTPSAAPAPYFQALDVVRFAAAALLLTYHSFDHWLTVPTVAALANNTSGNTPTWWATKLKLLVGNFTFGVDIFFLLSGFLITYLLLLEQQRYGRINIKSFYLRRVLRIWPLYYLAVALGPVLTHFVHEPAINLP